MEVIPLSHHRRRRYVFKSRALPPHLDDNALICISLPDKAERSLARAKRGGEVYEIGGRCVVVSARDPSTRYRRLWLGQGRGGEVCG